MHKSNCLPIVNQDKHLISLVFRKDYNEHKQNENELIDVSKRYNVGARINTRDYEKRNPALIEAVADFVKVGIGGGAICITREQKGIGCGQAPAIMEVTNTRDEYYKETGVYIPICSDGGILHDYHIILALLMEQILLCWEGILLDLMKAIKKSIYQWKLFERVLGRWKCKSQK